MRDDEKGTYRADLEDAVRVHDQCLAGIAPLLQDKTIQIDGKECKVTVTQRSGELLVDVLNPTERLGRLEFRMVHTGRWRGDEIEDRGTNANS